MVYTPNAEPPQTKSKGQSKKGLEMLMGRRTLHMTEINVQDNMTLRLER